MGQGDDAIITCTNSVCEKIRKNLQSIQIPNNVTIFKVPSQLDCEYINACRPRHISIGPYHRGEPELEAMEVHKLDYLQMFLERIRPRLQLEDLVSKITEMEMDARSCYSDPISMGKDDFIQTMLLDGCFIIEFMLKLQPRETTDPIVLPFLSTRWKWLFILPDLLALENQLPFSVLQYLYNLVHTDEKLIEKLFNLFTLSPTELFAKLLTDLSKDRKKISQLIPHHLLHLFQLALSQGVSVQSKSSHVNEQLVTTRLYRPAVELELSGVKFKTENVGRILDVTFSKGVLEMTHLTIDEHCVAFLRNFVALEQCSREYSMHFSSYVRFMGGLVDSKKDVELLVKKGIIRNSMGSNDDIVNDFFKPICNDIVVNHGENHLAVVLSEIGEYCKPTLRKWKVMLLKDYFSSPWSILSFLAAVLLLGITILQASVIIVHYANHRP